MRTKYLAIAFAIAVLLCAFVPVTNGVLADDSVSVEINEETFPDDVFRDMASRNYDDNRDGILSSEELDRVDSLSLSGVNDFSSIKYFTQITSLTIAKSDREMIRKAFPDNEKLNTIYIENCPNLTTLGLSRKGINILGILNCPKLESYKEYQTNNYGIFFALKVPALKELDLQEDTTISVFSASDAAFTSLDYSKIGLTGLTLSDCKELEPVDLSSFSSLQILALSNVAVKNVDVSRCSNMRELTLDLPDITSLDLKNLRGLKHLEVTAPLATLDLTNCLNLSQLYNEGEKVQSEDHADCYDYVSDNSALSAYSLTLNKKTKVQSADTKILTIDETNFGKVLANKLKGWDFNKNGVIDPDENAYIYLIDTDGENIGSDDLRGLELLTSLEAVWIKGGSTDELTFKDIPKINSIQYNDCKKVKGISIATSDTLKAVHLTCEEIDKIDLGAQPNLRFLTLVLTGSGVGKKYVDISRCPMLVKLISDTAPTETSTTFEYLSNDGSITISKNIVLVSDITINVSAQNGSVSGAGKYGYGSKVTLKATPDTGYKFAGWIENGKVVSKDASYSFTAEAARDLTAKFEKIPAATPTATPVPKTTTTPKPTAKPSNTKTAADGTDSGISGFVSRIYSFVLDREPEEDGAKFWSDELYNFRRTGAQVAMDFLFTPEFESRNTTNEQFVTILYKTFFGRDPEEDGFNYWVNELASGNQDRVTVAQGFVYSQEWANTCAEYGILSGGNIKPEGKIAASEMTYSFVERLYTTALGRAFDDEGREYWASELANFNLTGEQAGAAFFLSDEMTSYGLSDEEFLNRLYATFMDREPDEEGAAYWLEFMNGNDRSSVVFGFTRSPEFTEKCVKARILPY